MKAGRPHQTKRATNRSAIAVQKLATSRPLQRERPVAFETKAGTTSARSTKEPLQPLAALIAMMPVEPIVLAPPFGKRSDGIKKVALQEELQQLSAAGKLSIVSVTSASDPLGRLATFDGLGVQVSEQAIEAANASGANRALNIAVLRSVLMAQQVSAGNTDSASARWKTTLNAAVKVDGLLEATRLATASELREPMSDLSGVAYYPAAGFDEAALKLVAATFPRVEKVLHVDPIYVGGNRDRGLNGVEAFWVPGDAFTFSVEQHVGERPAVVFIATAGDFGSLMSEPKFIGQTVSQLKVGGALVNSAGWGGQPLLGHLPLEVLGLQRTSARDHPLGSCPVEVLEKVREVDAQRAASLVELDRDINRITEGTDATLPPETRAVQLKALLERATQLDVRAATEGAIWRTLTLANETKPLSPALQRFRKGLAQPVPHVQLMRQSKPVVFDTVTPRRDDLMGWMNELAAKLAEADQGQLEKRFAIWDDARANLTPLEQATHARELDELEQRIGRKVALAALGQLDRQFVDGAGHPLVPVLDLPLLQLSNADPGPAADLQFAADRKWLRPDEINSVLRDRLAELKRAIAADPALSKRFRTFDYTRTVVAAYEDKRWGIAPLYAVLKIAKHFNVLSPSDMKATFGEMDAEDLNWLRAKELSGLVSSYQSFKAFVDGTWPVEAALVEKFASQLAPTLQAIKLARDRGEFPLLHARTRAEAEKILATEA